jgi:hypothetical protein
MSLCDYRSYRDPIERNETPLLPIRIRAILIMKYQQGGVVMGSCRIGA